MLLYVLESSGSSPGRQGFGMAVNLNGEMEGSIGGGIMEHKFVEMAKDQLQRNAGMEQATIRKQIHDKSSTKNQSGMICSGEQTNFLYQLIPEDFIVVENLIRCLSQNRPGLLQLSPRGISFSETVAGEPPFYFDRQSDQDWFYREKIGYKNSLFIIGGGHCSLAFSKIMSMMDFHISVYDTRRDLHTMTLNTYAHQKYFLEDYSELKDLIVSGNDRYVVIMTFGYRTDEIAVRSLVTHEFKYLGLLGSSTKIKKLLSDLKKKGFSQEQLSRVHAPVGMPINSQTPEEIAVSIAAEIIQVKNIDLKKTNPVLKKSFSN